MWIKLDDGFATHPKILAAGFIAMGIQLRAICYASQNKTDGFIHANAVPLLLIGLAAGGIATEIDWPSHLVKHGLWEPRECGYHVHDYLDWNVSRKHYETLKKKLSKAGHKGMNSRWKHRNQPYNPPYNPPYNESITSPSTSTSSLSSLSSHENKKEKKKEEEGKECEKGEGKECEKMEPEWLLQFRRNPIYSHVDFDREIGKMKVWQGKPANKKRQINQSFVINWINKIEPPLSHGHEAALTCPHHPELVFDDLNALTSHNFRYHPKYEG